MKGGIETKTMSIDELVVEEENREEIERTGCPIPLGFFPNQMGINLCSVESITWTQRDDGQLVSVSIQFIPTAKE
jgi:hypothetical protein